MLEVEVLGASRAPGAPAPAELARLCELAAARLGVHSGHVAVEFVDARRIAELNARHRHRDGPTDVLSFPIDGADALQGARGAAVPSGPGAAGAGGNAGPPRELGDVVICAEHTADVREAVLHGVLHLLGMDHDTDDGEMLALQDELLAEHERHA
jgi:probable rRNA maturation factor